MLGIWTSLILVVSGGGSAATDLGLRLSSPPVPASVSPSKNCRRLNPVMRWLSMEASVLSLQHASLAHSYDFKVFGFDVCCAIGCLVVLCPKVLQVTTQARLLVLGQGGERPLRRAVVASEELHSF
jgi:hypothetical protein